MKKIVSILLAIVLVVGVTFPAFGAGFAAYSDFDFSEDNLYLEDNRYLEEEELTDPILPVIPEEEIDPSILLPPKQRPTPPRQRPIPPAENPTQPPVQPLIPLQPPVAQTPPPVPTPPPAQPTPLPPPPVVPIPLALGFSGEATIPGGGTVTTNLPGTMSPGSTFQVLFEANAFKWTGNPGGGYAQGKINQAWVQITGGVLGRDFAITGFGFDTITGRVRVTIQALIPYSGTLRIQMNSGVGGTAFVEKAIVVADTVATITKTKAGGTPPSLTSHTGNPEVYPGDPISFRVPADNFVWSNAGRQNAQPMKDTSWIRLKGGRIGTDFKVALVTPPNSHEVLVQIIPLKAGTYKNVSISLLGGGGVETAASAPITVQVQSVGNGKITGIAGGSQLGGKGSGALLNGKIIPNGQLGGLEVRNKDELLIPLYAGFFTWEGTPPFAESPVTTAQLRQGKIGIQRASRSGSRAIDSKSPEIVNRNGQAYVLVKFTDETTTLTDIDFGMTMFLTIDRSRHYESGVEIYGTLIQDLLEAEFDGEYFDISDGSVIEALNFIRNSELYLGSGVTMYSSLYSGKRYAGTATNEVEIEDDNILRKFPSIEDVIRIKTKTLNKSSNTVSFEGYPSNMYVYGEDGSYLGRSNQRIPYSAKYYLSSQQINLKDFLEDNNILEPGVPLPGRPEPGDDGPSKPGGNWEEIVTPPNVNQNPGTGR